MQKLKELVTMSLYGVRKLKIFITYYKKNQSSLFISLLQTWLFNCCILFLALRASFPLYSLVLLDRGSIHYQFFVFLTQKIGNSTHHGNREKETSKTKN